MGGGACGVDVTTIGTVVGVAVVVADGNGVDDANVGSGVGVTRLGSAVNVMGNG